MGVGESGRLLDFGEAGTGRAVADIVADAGGKEQNNGSRLTISGVEERLRSLIYLLR